MSIFDEEKPVNIPLPVVDGQVFWDVLAERNGYRLEQNKITGHCRILDEHSIRVAWGPKDLMEEELRRLANGPVRLRYGDVIGVHRYGGVYDHYGVYESDACVYEYAAADGDFGEPFIHRTTIEKFIGDSENCFVLRFPRRHEAPEKVEADIRRIVSPPPSLRTRVKMAQIRNADTIVSARIPDEVWRAMGIDPSSSGAHGISEEDAARAAQALERLFHTDVTGLDAVIAGVQTAVRLLPSSSCGTYHLYSPTETIQRARRRLGEAQYNLLTNNCEHYALWCKTGIAESYQVNALRDAVCESLDCE